MNRSVSLRRGRREIKELVPQNINFVVKSNCLIEAQYKLSLLEIRLVLYFIGFIHPDDEKLKVYRVNIKKLAKDCGLSEAYTLIRKTTENLVSRLIKITEKDSITTVAWLSRVRYYPQKGYMDIYFDYKLKPYLVGLEKNFTHFKLESTLRLRSAYAVRIYLLLKERAGLRKRIFYLDDLLTMLEVPESLKLYGSFKQCVLIPAMTSINKETDIVCSFSEIKIGRRVQKIEFKITKKDPFKNMKPSGVLPKNVEVKDSVNLDAKENDYVKRMMVRIYNDEFEYGIRIKHNDAHKRNIIIQAVNNKGVTWLEDEWFEDVNDRNLKKEAVNFYFNTILKCCNKKEN